MELYWFFTLGFGKIIDALASLNWLGIYIVSSYIIGILLGGLAYYGFGKPIHDYENKRMVMVNSRERFVMGLIIIVFVAISPIVIALILLFILFIVLERWLGKPKIKPLELYYIEFSIVYIFIFCFERTHKVIKF